jgi:hypothetical protein
VSGTRLMQTAIFTVVSLALEVRGEF